MPPKRNPAKGRRRHNGEGTISGPRKDGRYVAAFYAPTTAGTYKRVYVYGKTWDQAHDRLVEEQSKAVRGIPVAAESWKLGPYLGQWLENVVKLTRRAATYANYETYTRLYLKPGLGHHRLRRLSVAHVQRFLNSKLAEGQSVRNVQLMRQVLSAALTRAAREELISRNVARLAELPAWEPCEIRPWSADEVSLLKKLHVPPRDAQMILGHAHISTTMQIYTLHVDEEARDDALIGLDKLLGGGR